MAGPDLVDPLQDRIERVPDVYTQAPVLVGMAPLLVMIVLVAGLWLVLLRRLSRLNALT